MFSCPMPFRASREVELAGDLSATLPACVRGQAWHDSHRMDLLSVAWCGRESASCALDSPSAGHYSGPQKQRATGRRACLSPATATGPQSGCGDWVMHSTGVVQGNKASALCGEEHHTHSAGHPGKFRHSWLARSGPRRTGFCRPVHGPPYRLLFGSFRHLTAMHQSPIWRKMS